MSKTQLKAWQVTLRKILSELNAEPPNLEMVERIEKNLDGVIRQRFSIYSSATLVIWALRLLRLGYRSNSTRANHLLGFLSAEAIGYALRYGKQENLGPNKNGNFQRCFNEASEDHSDLLKLVQLKRIIRWIYDSAKVINETDPSYAQKRLGVKEALKSISDKWKGIDPLSSEIDEEYTIRPIFFLNRPLVPEEEISLAERLVDPIWEKEYGFRYSSLLQILFNLKNFCDEKGEKAGVTMYVNRVEGKVIQSLASTVPVSESKKVIDFLSWDKNRIITLEDSGQDPTKLLMNCALIKYSTEDRYLTSNHLLYWSLGTLSEAPRFDGKLQRVAKDLSMFRQFDLWKKYRENEVLNDYKDFFEQAGFRNLEVQKVLPDCGEVDLLGVYEDAYMQYGIICELKELRSIGMSTYDYVRRAYFIEEQPAIQVNNKICMLTHSDKAQKAFLRLTKTEVMPKQLVPLIILNGQPLSYSGDVPLITIYDTPTTVKKKIKKYLNRENLPCTEVY
jgi:hypothetical protein